MTYPSLVSITVVGLTIWASPVPVVAADPHAPVPAEFSERVARFVDLHQAVAHFFGVDVVCADVNELSEHDRVFANALRQARRFAKAGDIFTSDVASSLRERLTAAVHKSALDSSVRIVAATTWTSEETEELPDRLEVNDEFPSGLGRSALQSLLWSLPPLPRELEYRFYGTSLILVDIRANLVVDVLADALPVNNELPSSSRTQTPCDVHPELPACWT